MYKPLDLDLFLGLAGGQQARVVTDLPLFRGEAAAREKAGYQLTFYDGIQLASFCFY